MTVLTRGCGDDGSARGGRVGGVVKFTGRSSNPSHTISWSCGVIAAGEVAGDVVEGRGTAAGTGTAAGAASGRQPQ